MTKLGVVPARIINKADLVVTITYTPSESVEKSYSLTILKASTGEFGMEHFGSFGELTDRLDDLCDEVHTEWLADDSR